MLLASQIAVALQSDTVPINAYDAVKDKRVSAVRQRNTRQTRITHPHSLRRTEDDRVAPALNEGAHAAACGREKHLFALAEKRCYLGNQYVVSHKMGHCVGFESCRLRVVIVSLSCRYRV